MKLVVASLDQAQRMAAAHAATAVLSLLSREQPTPSFGALPHLRLAFNDVAGPSDGLVPPSARDLDALLAFHASLPASATLLVHCWMGVSRSPAAALILASKVRPDVAEAQLAQHLRRLSPTATPNPLMIELADRRLERSGRLSEAVRRLGRGAEFDLALPFAWSLDGDAGFLA